MNANTFRRALVRWSAPLLVLVLVSGCATGPDPSDAEAVAEFKEINDIGEPTNRAIFGFNRFLDKVILKPLASGYRKLPDAVQRSIHNFLNNLRSPVIFFNDILQGKPSRAGTTLARFVINSTIGVVGLGDVADDMGFAFHNEDFGQTLALWGLGDGPYVMLPIFGPSNPRDAIGLVADFFADPLNIWLGNIGYEAAIVARGGLRGVDERARNFDALEDLERSSLDFYAAIRSLYRQRRTDQISDGEGSAILPAPTLGGEEPLFPAPAPGGEVSQMN
ncbi:MAG: VacJ family lipoprotein [Rhodospirillales bacterium]|jgi:phospholipid-binding lipoprotein MlaA|nr:VacJ family lipoprotein [Rhodospirillales bacterium]